MYTFPSKHVDLYLKALAWDKLEHPSSAIHNSTFKNSVASEKADILKAASKQDRWKDHVLDAINDFDVSVLAEHNVINRSYDDKGWYSPVVLHDNFTSGVFDSTGQRFLLMIGYNYNREILADYKGISLRIDPVKEGVSFVRLYHPTALDDENDSCVIGEMKLAGAETSMSGNILRFSGHIVSFDFWAELPDFGKKNNPYFPSNEYGKAFKLDCGFVEFSFWQEDV